ncbi:hypothetical protein [Telmatospirillum siberiense]|uniref:hypothetical protein n=1 Tax=Telmatospirillum siberiense TaxID=382514 RepID=UPI0011AFCBAF|nr:hypothetical protein [Telmatospirillum siberiense]
MIDLSFMLNTPMALSLSESPAIGTAAREGIGPVKRLAGIIDQEETLDPVKANRCRPIKDDYDGEHALAHARDAS